MNSSPKTIASASKAAVLTFKKPNLKVEAEIQKAIASGFVVKEIPKDYRNWLNDLVNDTLRDDCDAGERTYPHLECDEELIGIDLVNCEHVFFRDDKFAYVHMVGSEIKLLLVQPRK